MINENIVPYISFNGLSLYLRICKEFKDKLHYSIIGNIMYDCNSVYIKCPREYKKFFDSFFENEWAENVIIEYILENDDYISVKLTSLHDMEYNNKFLTIYNEYIDKVKSIYPIDNKKFLIEFDDVSVIEEIEDSFKDDFDL